jgi:tetratricopeptide (TPR) repeat protein
MNCPRCGLSDAGDVSCAGCGVVFAKLAARPQAPRPAPVTRAAPSRSSSGFSAWLWLIVGLVALGTGVAVVVRPSGQGGKAPLRTAAVPAPPVAEPADLPPPPALDVPQALPSAPPLELKNEGLSTADRDAARLLAARLDRSGATEVQQAEQLYSRHPGDAELRQLLSAVLQSAAQRAQAERRPQQAAEWLQKAAANATDAQPFLSLAAVLSEQNDWAGAEAAARGALALEPRNEAAWTLLGYALLRQDRGRESAEALQNALAIRDDPGTRALLSRVSKGLHDESGMTQQTLSHFNVRYDGQEHEGVGREILRALERHYATLASTLDHQPAASIPVILFSGQAYYDAAGAPAWSGGAYDTLDGRIRIPIGGLTPSLTPDMDGTLIHELTHAFVADRSHGMAPREIHEGLAQYMEGKRCESELGPEGLRALADNRVPGVIGFYMGALSYVEYLMANRGQGGINELLAAMADSGNLEDAFQKVHGRGYQETRRLWKERLRQQYGS